MNRVQIDQALPGRLLAVAGEMLKESAAPGAAIAVWLDGVPILETGVGYADAGHSRPLPVSARFYLYSLTKTFIAAALLQQAARGALALDRPIQDYLPGLALPRPVTVRQLLNHSAALADYGGLAAYQEAVRSHPEVPWPEARFLALAASTEPAPPRWRYSNPGFLILKLLLQRISGASLQDALAAQLFMPIQLRDTFVAESLADAATLTPGYSRFFHPQEEPEDVTGRYHPGWVSHGVVISTARDTAHLFQALFAGDLLPPELRAAMAEPLVLPFTHPLFRQPAYGLGAMIDAASPYGLVIGHAGGGPGYATGALCFPQVAGHTITSVALANGDVPDLGLAIAHRLAADIAEALAA
jgi:D-alanyl-D-alanine carboxypeptidase